MRYFFAKQTGPGKFGRFGKYSVWVWIGYQTVKGTLTTIFIWAPLVYLHFFS